MAEIKCPCGLRVDMDEEDCVMANCDECCPLANGEQPKPMTNYDHFCNMPIDEMARFLLDLQNGVSSIPVCQHFDECWDDLSGITEEKCFQCMVDWLRKPYET